MENTCHQYQTTSLTDRQRLIGAYENGEDWLSLAWQLGVSEQTAQNILKKFLRMGEKHPGAKALRRAVVAFSGRGKETIKGINTSWNLLGLQFQPEHACSILSMEAAEADVVAVVPSSVHIEEPVYKTTEGEKSKPKADLWTPESIEIKINTACTSAEKCMTALSTFHTENNIDTTNREFRRLVEQLNGLYFTLKGGPLSARLKARCRIADQVLEHNFIPIYAILLERVMDVGISCKFALDTGSIDRVKYLPAKNLLSFAFNFSDASEKMGTTLCKEDRYLNCLIRILNELRHDYLQGTLLEDVTSNIVRVAISSAYNLMIYEVADNIRRIHDSGMIETVKPYLQVTKHEKLVATLLLFFAYAFTEKDAELFLSQKKTIDFLINCLRIAIKDIYKRGKGYSAIELAKGLERLAKNDTNKKQLVEQGILPVLVEMVSSDTLEEREVAYRIAWTLAFEPENRERIETEMASVLRGEQQIPYAKKEEETDSYVTDMMSRIDKAKKGVLFVLEDRKGSGLSDDHSRLQTKKTQGRKRISIDGSKSLQIMLSYSWANKDIVKKLCESLRQLKYDVWIDVERMTGNTLDAMASAVEESVCVIICVSKSYKESQNCRSEAEYAYRLKKKLVPIVVEPKYRADGWLGFMMGSKLYFDFSGKYPFEVKFEELRSELKNLIGTPSNSAAIIPMVESPIKSAPTPTPHAKPPAPAPPELPPQSNPISGDTPDKPDNIPTHQKPGTAADDPLAYLSQWSKDQITTWYNTNGMNSFSFRLDGLTGHQLRFMKNVKVEAPEFFYRVIENKLRLSNLQEIVLFVEALDKL